MKTHSRLRLARLAGLASALGLNLAAALARGADTPSEPTLPPKPTPSLVSTFLADITPHCFLTPLWAGGAVTPPATAPYSAHEWGTFTSVQGSDGKPIRWDPFLVSDLPSFVHTRRKPADGPAVKAHSKDFAMLDLKSDREWLQRMETPVIYFHADRPLEVDVRVDFPSGLVTEWYPAASAFGPMFVTNPFLNDSDDSHAEWKGLRILARGATPPAFPHEGKPSHYYPAREARANPILTTRGLGRSTDGAGETENHLFYRGVANFTTPLRVSQPADAIVVENTGREPLSDLFIWSARGTTASLVPIRSLAPGESTRSTGLTDRLEGDRTRLTTEFKSRLQQSLTRAGLNSDEAHAMIQTWADSWFDEDGTRVLYLVPRPFTDRILPLRLNPAPAKLERVFVGRAELLTRDIEQKASSLAADFFAVPDAATARQLRALTVPRFQGALLHMLRDRQIEARRQALAREFIGETLARRVTDDTREIEARFNVLASRQ